MLKLKHMRPFSPSDERGAPAQAERGLSQAAAHRFANPRQE
jgi:hypothetical protein